MKKFIKKIMFLDVDIEKLHAIKNDIHDDNRRCVVLYSSIIIGGMSILLFLSLFVDVLVSSQKTYIAAIAIGLFTLLIALFLAKKHRWLTVIAQYVLIAFLLAFGIVLGTKVEPTRESASYAVMIFVAPLLFTDMPYRINAATVISMIAYVFAAKATQSPEMFGFNMSVILPYGIANLVLTHFTAKMKIERTVYAHEKRIMGEYDRLTGMLNRWSFERDMEDVEKKKDKECGFCSFDLNNLKAVNDKQGHDAGDEMIIAAARALENVIGKYGKCYRIGGDEFAAIIEGIFPSSNELLKMLNKETARYHSNEYDFVLSISGGIVEGRSENANELMNEADRMMYMNKDKYYIENGIDRRRY